jgi:hypothetical protein
MFSSLEFELGSVWEASGAGNCLGVTPSISRWPFGYRHGLRASELVALRWDDIDLALVEIGLFIAVLLFGYYWVAREE